VKRPYPIVEIVLVLLCLFLVACFVLPWLARSRDGYRDSCLNRLKHLGLAMKMYAQDFGDHYAWRVGVENPSHAWRDLGMLYPNYCARFENFICPGSSDLKLQAPSIPDDKDPLEPFAGDRAISYGYGIDATGTLVTGWTESSTPTVRLAADKKAGTRIGSPGNPAKLANHNGNGRNVLYQDGHVSWKAGGDALDPDEEDDAVGAPGAHDYRRWWSDPPYSRQEREVEEQ
jgi:prepilin-type processing-associated H-X9-DG protein